jgi:hypothetical protein
MNDGGADHKRSLPNRYKATIDSSQHHHQQRYVNDRCKTEQKGFNRFHEHHPARFQTRHARLM